MRQYGSALSSIEISGLKMPRRAILPVISSICVVISTVALLDMISRIGAMRIMER